MAAPAWVAPVTQAVGQAGVGILDNLWKRKGVKDQNEWNRRQSLEQRDWNYEMWHKENAYNLKLWHMQNEYNHPAQQMARMKEAGLNPRLMYGSSPGSMEGAPMASAADVKGYDRAEARNVNEGFNAFSEMYRLSNLKAVTDNIKAQEQVAEQEKLIKSEQAFQEAIKSRVEAKKEGHNIQFETAIANRDLIQQQAWLRASDAYVARSTQDVRVKQAEETFNSIIKKNKGQDLINELRRLEKNLNEQGLQKSDQLIFRMLIQNGFTPEKIIQIFNPFIKR